MLDGDETPLRASNALLGAALSGLLCVASATCTSSSSTSGSKDDASSGSGARSGATSSGTTSNSSGSKASTTSSSASGTGAGTTTGSSGAGGASTASSSGTGGSLPSGDTPIPDTECDGGVSPDPQVTMSTMEALTLQQFTALCQQANGILETQPHCGGSNACRGFSYDSETQTLVQHTCRATNSCGGWSCVVCD